MSEATEVATMEAPATATETTAPESAPVKKSPPKPKKAPTVKDAAKAVAKIKAAKKKAKEAKASPVKPTSKAKPSTNGTHRSVRNDGARQVAKASEGKLNVDQVRVLRYLKTCKRPVDRADIKEGVGIGREGKYSSGWLNSLWNLHQRRPGLIKIEEHEPESGHAKHTHSITADGKAILDASEKAAAKAEKEATKGK